MSQDNATVRRWHLSNRLRELREHAGLTHDQVIERLKGTGKWSRPKLSRIENREQGVKTREVEQLLDVYQVTDPALREELVDLANTAHQRGWMLDIRKSLPQDFHAVLNWEAALVGRRQFETLLVPGLLQTADYARSLITGIHPSLSEEEVENRVAARMARQQILNRSNPAQLHAILDMGVLERPVGSARIMRNQLRRLVEAAEASHITVQVLPKSAGASPALEGPFSILTLPDPVPDTGYAEGPLRAVYIEDREEVRAYTLRFGRLMAESLSAAESARVITDAAQHIQEA
ncbi:transcriptional regulator with XRE-family HTH domain [Actinokineospora baliensis]|uniref:helix-turn-helix domain-containing protein n=1 Tax=Actinokineospora baliensis TaxID=547056 RepID=UPI00195ACBB2|nr:helix-turn-helix transcriptional regulator [Actinokineospora baliensis]MBM7775727.1 transcriptional regulator with XRE-family HTH domain [Actinokineospora baliensis]